MQTGAFYSGQYKQVAQVDRVHINLFDRPWMKLCAGRFYLFECAQTMALAWVLGETPCLARKRFLSFGSVGFYSLSGSFIL